MLEPKLPSHMVGEFVLAKIPATRTLQPAELLDTNNMPPERIASTTSACPNLLVRFVSARSNGTDRWSQVAATHHVKCESTHIPCPLSVLWYQCLIRTSGTVVRPTRIRYQICNGCGPAWIQLQVLLICRLDNGDALETLAPDVSNAIRGNEWYIMDALLAVKFGTPSQAQINAALELFFADAHASEGLCTVTCYVC